MFFRIIYQYTRLDLRDKGIFNLDTFFISSIRIPSEIVNSYFITYKKVIENILNLITLIGYLGFRYNLRLSEIKDKKKISDPSAIITI